MCYYFILSVFSNFVFKLNLMCRLRMSNTLYFEWCGLFVFDQLQFFLIDLSSRFFVSFLRWCTILMVLTIFKTAGFRRKVLYTTLSWQWLNVLTLWLISFWDVGGRSIRHYYYYYYYYYLGRHRGMLANGHIICYI